MKKCSSCKKEIPLNQKDLNWKYYSVEHEKEPVNKIVFDWLCLDCLLKVDMDDERKSVFGIRIFLNELSTSNTSAKFSFCRHCKKISPSWKDPLQVLNPWKHYGECKKSQKEQERERVKMVLIESLREQLEEE